MNNNPKTTGQADGLAEHAQDCRPAPKWAALIDEVVVPMPRAIVEVDLLRSEGEVPPDSVLVRDLDSPEDQVLADTETINLAEGNVFYRLKKCDAGEARQRGDCVARAKLAFFVDDRPEVTINPRQTGKSLRELFGLTEEVNLFRDHDSPDNDLVGIAEAIIFSDGPVFYTRRDHVKLTIIVNNKPFTDAEGVKRCMTGRQIAALVSSNPDATEVFRLKGGQPLPIPLAQEVHIENCEEFRVIRNNVAGGFEPSRVERELNILKQGGRGVEFVTQPAAVIYRDVPTRPGYHHAQATDVLVLVPSGYPGQPLDGAFLPAGSPLLGRVAGAVQHAITVAGRAWHLVSYHPHGGGGGPAWNKDRHGFHTYFDEILYWVHRANN